MDKMTDALKVGDRVRIIAEDIYKDEIGEIIKINIVADVWLPDGDIRKYRAFELQKITNEEPTMQDEKVCASCNKSFCICNKTEELKLEVGRKYDVADSNYNPYIYLYDTRQYGFKSDSPYHFLDCDGDNHQFTEEDLRDIKEHREPYKHSWNDVLCICKGHLGIAVLESQAKFLFPGFLCADAKKIPVEITVKEKEIEEQND